MSASDHSSDQLDHHLAGSLIPQTYLDRLRELGLWWYVAPHCFNYGVRIYKPLSAGGNGNADYEPIELVTFLDSDGESKMQTLSPESDAPVLIFFHQPGHAPSWIVYGVDCSGGMGPADFVNTWSTAEEAIADIKDFYFGDPTRVNAKAAFRRDPVGEIQRARREGRMPL